METTMDTKNTIALFQRGGQQNVMEYYWKGSLFTAIPPTSAFEVVGQHNKIRGITFRAALVSGVSCLKDGTKTYHLDTNEQNIKSNVGLKVLLVWWFVFCLFCRRVRKISSDWGSEDAFVQHFWQYPINEQKREGKQASRQERNVTGREVGEIVRYYTVVPRFLCKLHKYL